MQNSENPWLIKKKYNMIESAEIKIHPGLRNDFAKVKISKRVIKVKIHSWKKKVDDSTQVKSPFKSNNQNFSDIILQY